jgi:Tol biopolymer transport system component
MRNKALSAAAKPSVKGLFRSLTTMTLVFACAVAVGCGGSTAHSEPPLAAISCCSKIVLLDGGGATEALTEGEQPKWAPDHRTLIFTRADYEAEPGPTNDIWSINRNGERLTRITWVPAPNQVRSIAYGGRPAIIAYDDDSGIWTMTPDGSRSRLLVPDGGNANSLAISPDGSKIAYVTNSTVRSPFSLRVADMHGTGKEVAFPGTSHTCSVASPSWSPDSDWIAFSLCVDKGGFNDEFGIWVVRPDGSDLHRIAANGNSPAWSPDGEWIAFVTSKIGSRTAGELTAVAKVHPDGSSLELMTPYTSEGSSETYESLDWGG